MGWNLIGHSWAEAILRKHVDSGQVRHAYLITGDDAVGKRTLAVRFAQALTCLEAEEPGEYCGTCRTCTAIAEGRFPDFHLILPEDGSNTLKVEQMRELKRQLALSPFQSRWRIALIPDFELATESAANALLKTLREPGEHVIVLLTAIDDASLLPTIVSRCEQLPLKSVAKGHIKQAMNQLGVPDGLAELISGLAQGRPGWALRYAEDQEYLEQRALRLDQLSGLLRQSRTERYDYVDKLLPRKDDLDTQRRNVSQVLHEWGGVWRDAMHMGYAAAVPVVNADQMELVKSLNQLLTPGQIYASVEAVQRTQQAVERYANVRLAMEVLMLELPHLGK